MSKLYSSREIAAVLQKLGFIQTSQKGSHAKFKNSSEKIVIVPMAKKEIPEGTFRSILKQAEITLSIFKDNL
jgi:predicted RNA binding protein YcfA (HicA-like mRNA interferase family)